MHGWHLASLAPFNLFTPSVPSAGALQSAGMISSYTWRVHGCSDGGKRLARRAAAARLRASEMTRGAFCDERG